VYYEDTIEKQHQKT